MIEQPALEHGTTRTGRWLRHNRTRIAFWIAIVEAILLVFGVINRWGALLIAVLIIVGYFAIATRLRSMVVRDAAWIAAGMEAEVIVVDTNLDRLRFIDQIHKGRIITLMSDRLTLEQRVREADVVIGSVLVPGARAPKLITEDMIRSMRTGAVAIDIAIDQGGCMETSRMTTHSDPTYVVDGVVHYCVGNMPGAVPNTSTYALTNVTLPYALRIATRGLEDAVRADAALGLGVNVIAGEVTNPGVAEAHTMRFTPLSAIVDRLS
jgi:alanine dehydrogenase